MKVKCIIMVLGLLMVQSTYAAEEAALVIEAMTGTEQSVAISRIGKVKFERDTMFVYAHDNTLLGKSAVREIQAIHYAQTKVPTKIQTVTSSDNVRIYPNPTQDRLIIENIQADNVYIFDLSGHLVYNKALQPIESNTVDVQVLPKGEYVLLINTQIFKFIKQ